MHGLMSQFGSRCHSRTTEHSFSEHILPLQHSLIIWDIPFPTLLITRSMLLLVIQFPPASPDGHYLRELYRLPFPPSVVSTTLFEIGTPHFHCPSPDGKRFATSFSPLRLKGNCCENSYADHRSPTGHGKTVSGNQYRGPIFINIVIY